MEYKFQYENESEKLKLLEDNKSKIWIEEQSFLDGGNYLIFADEPRAPQPIYINMPKEELDDLKNQVLEMQSYIIEQEYKNLLSTGGM
jgi:hypothetical protein